MDRLVWLRLAMIAVACVLVALNVQYIVFKIPEEKVKVSWCRQEITTLYSKLEEVKRFDAEIEELKYKISTLVELERARIKYGRLLETLADSIPDGIWLTGFAVTDEPGQSHFYRTPLGGKRYCMSITGYSTAETQMQADTELVGLLDNIRKHFAVPDVDDRGKPSNWGFDESLGARFDPPWLLTHGAFPFFEPVPAIVMTEKQQKLIDSTKIVVATLDRGDYTEVVTKVVWPKATLPFRIKLIFEIPAASSN